MRRQPPLVRPGLSRRSNVAFTRDRGWEGAGDVRHRGALAGWASQGGDTLPQARLRARSRGGGRSRDAHLAGVAVPLAWEQGRPRGVDALGDPFGAAGLRTARVRVGARGRRCLPRGLHRDVEGHGALGHPRVGLLRLHVPDPDDGPGLEGASLAAGGRAQAPDGPVGAPGARAPGDRGAAGVARARAAPRHRGGSGEARSVGHPPRARMGAARRAGARGPRPPVP